VLYTAAARRRRLEGTVLHTLTIQSFEPRLGEIFLLSTPSPDDDRRIELRLTGVRGNGLRGTRDREQFSLHFLGPRDPLLPQMIYRLENPAMGGLEIFLVPVGRDAAGVTYEAVFA
jgi:hypothetical protein